MTYLKLLWRYYLYLHGQLADWHISVKCWQNLSCTGFVITDMWSNVAKIPILTPNLKIFSRFSKRSFSTMNIVMNVFWHWVIVDMTLGRLWEPEPCIPALGCNVLITSCLLNSPWHTSLLNKMWINDAP